MATVLQVQKMLGHAKPSITLDVYSFLLDGSEARLGAEFDAVIPVALVPKRMPELSSERTRNSSSSDRKIELVTPREMNVDGETLWYSPADIFAHVLHERQHHRDLNTLLYQLGVEPPIVELPVLLSERGPVDLCRCNAAHAAIAAAGGSASGRCRVG